jgi:hypothetical protein
MTRSSNQVDDRCDEWDGRSMPASRSVVSMLLRELGDFSLHPQGRPAGGRLRRPSSASRTHTSWWTARTLRPVR